MRDHLEVREDKPAGLWSDRFRIAQKRTLPASCACGYAPCMISGRVAHEVYPA